MTDRRPHPRDWLRPGDEAILEAVGAAGPDRLPLIAAARGLHLAYVEKRCPALESRGLIERPGGGTTYRLTDRGARFLRGDRSVGDARGPSLGAVEGD